MFEIAICDNDEKDLILLNEYAEQYFKENTEVEGKTECFLSAEELKCRMEKQKFDLFILDIVMPQTSGIELGRSIREKDDRVPIIYTTSSREFAFDAYGIHAFRYLEKPITQEELGEAISTAIHSHATVGVEKISVNTKKGIVAVKVEDIMYIENVSRCSVYVLKDGTEIVGTYNRNSFENSVEPLNRHLDFMQPHKSFFVNMRYIQTLQGDAMLLDNGKRIFISRNRIAAAKRSYLKYLSHEGERV